MQQTIWIIHTQNAQTQHACFVFAAYCVGLIHSVNGDVILLVIPNDALNPAKSLCCVLGLWMQFYFMHMSFSKIYTLRKVASHKAEIKNLQCLENT